MGKLIKERSFYRGALLLMLPLIAQNLVTQLMQLADNFMVGALGETELAAVTSANSVFFVLNFICFGIQSGTSVLVAQYNGRGSKDAINRVMGMGLYVSVGLTTLVAVLAASFPMEMMRLLTNNKDLWVPGADYARIVGFSYVFMSVSGIYVAVQRSMENPKLGAIIFTASGLLNVLLNYIFIFGKWGAPAMGCAGAALATLISRAFEVVVAAVYSRSDKRLPLRPALILRPGGIIAKDFIRYSVPVVLNETFWSAGISLNSVIMGHMTGSTAILAAYTIAGNLDRVMSVGLFAAGGAAAIIIGRDVVRHDRDTMRSEALSLNLLCLGVGMLSGILVLLLRAYLCESFIFPILDLSAKASSIAKYMMLVLALMVPVRSINLCNIVGVFRGGGDVKYSLMTDVTPMYLLTLPAAALAALVFGQPIELVYVIMCMDELIKFFICLPRLKSGKWINDVTRDSLLDK